MLPNAVISPFKRKRSRDCADKDGPAEIGKWPTVDHPAHLLADLLCFRSRGNDYAMSGKAQPEPICSVCEGQTPGSLADIHQSPPVHLTEAPRPESQQGESRGEFRATVRVLLLSRQELIRREDLS